MLCNIVVTSKLEHYLYTVSLCHYSAHSLTDQCLTLKLNLIVGLAICVLGLMINNRLNIYFTNANCYQIVGTITRI